MQEYWVNVFRSGISDIIHYHRESAIDGAKDGFNRNQSLYRIHVKMKPAIEPKYDDWQYGEILEKNYFKNNLE